MTYEVKLAVYEGPFDLLLDLISKQKVDIYEVSIAQIAREYLAYLEKIRELDLEITSEFLVVAATLLDIKAAGLLATDEEEIEEEISPFEVRNNLIAQLLEYKKFKNAASFLSTNMEEMGNYFTRPVGTEEEFNKVPADFLKDFTLDDLTRAFFEITAYDNISLVGSEHILTVPVSLDEKIDYILQRLTSKGEQTFKSLIGELETRAEVVTAFLALLELYKQDKIILKQSEALSEIEISLN